MSLSRDERFDRLTTEGVHAASGDLERLTALDFCRLMNREDGAAIVAVERVLGKIAEAIDGAAARLAAGGQVHYFGAGTSGRLGVLDAAECPPTFGVEATLFQGHLAGGRDAMFDAVEGAEDDAPKGHADASLAVLPDDVVVALSASGRTPYCLGVLQAARERGALTIAVVCNPGTPMHAVSDIVIDPVTGEEVLSGSTRLKAGTAQKTVLNMLSTGIMVRTGRTYGSLMVGVKANNDKLRDRARRLVTTITGCSAGIVESLQACQWDVRIACIMVAKGCDAAAAARRLERAGGFLRTALLEA